MAKGGKDNRSFKLTRRRKRKFAGHQFTNRTGVAADTPVNVNPTKGERINVDDC